MSKVFFGIIIGTFITINTVHANGKVNCNSNSFFNQLSVEEGIQLALEGNKRCFVYFTDSNCTGCKELVEVFTSENDKQLFEQYVFLNIRLDDFDGYAYKKEYEISSASEILIIDPFEINNSQRFIPNPKTFTESFNLIKANILESVKKTGLIPFYVKNVSNKNILLKSATSQIYQVEIDQFDNYLEAYKKCKRLKKQYKDLPLVVNNNIKNGIVNYKIYAGSFKSVEEAKNFIHQLKNKPRSKAILF